MPDQPTILDERTEQAVRELREALAAALGAVENVQAICDAAKDRIAVVDGVLAKLGMTREKNSVAFFDRATIARMIAPSLFQDGE